MDPGAAHSSGTELEEQVRRQMLGEEPVMVTTWHGSYRAVLTATSLSSKEASPWGQVANTEQALGLPLPPSTGHQARLRISSLWVTSRNHGLLNLGCSEVSRAPRQAREAKLDGRVDGALGKRLGKGGRGAKLPEEDASLG